MLKANFSEDNTSVERCLAVAGLPARDALALLAGEGRDGGAVTVGAAALSKPLVHPRTGCPLAHPVTSAALGNSHCAQIVEIIIVKDRNQKVFKDFSKIPMKTALACFWKLLIKTSLIILVSNYYELIKRQ